MEEKWVKMPKSDIFWANPQVVSVPRVPIPTMQRRSGTGTTQSGTGTHWQEGTGTGTGPSGTGIDVSCNPIFACYTTLSPVFVHRLFRDPNK